jgi:hypothetical protein
MKRETAQNGGRFEGIGNGAIYLRINQFQKGMLQFTDSWGCKRSPSGRKAAWARRTGKEP